jgi:hypothetical protein
MTTVAEHLDRIHLARQGRRLKFSEADYHQAMQAAFPGSQPRHILGKPSTVYHVPQEDARTVAVNYKPGENAAYVEFWDETPQGPEWEHSISPEGLRPGTVGLGHNLKRLIQSLGEQQVSISFGAEPRRLRLYQKALERAGFTLAWENDLGSFRHQLWVPPGSKPREKPVQLDIPIRVDTPVRKAKVNAPAGGVVVRGLYYQGGKYLPMSMVEKASFPQYQQITAQGGGIRQPQKYRRPDGSFDRAFLPAPLGDPIKERELAAVLHEEDLESEQ